MIRGRAGQSGTGVEEKKGTRRLRWADVEDNEEGKGAEEEEVRGVDESREAKFERDLRRLEEKKRTQEEAAEKEWIDGICDIFTCAFVSSLCQHCTCVHFRRALESQAKWCSHISIHIGCTN